MKIVQVVGFQNSGKTTLVEKIISYLTNKGIEVGSIKHHGHGGVPDSGLKKDSSKHMEAGAVISTVEGGGAMQLTSTLIKWDVHKILSLYQFLQMETVIVEGYKKEPFPKVVIIKREEDLHLLEKLTNIIAVVLWEGIEYKNHSSLPVYQIDRTNNLLKWIWEEVLKRDGENV